MIIDDEMHAIMVAPLPAGCRLTAIFDSVRPPSPSSFPPSFHPSLSLFVRKGGTRLTTDLLACLENRSATPERPSICLTSTPPRARSRSPTFSPRLARVCWERGCRTSRATWVGCSKVRTSSFPLLLLLILPLLLIVSNGRLTPSLSSLALENRPSVDFQASLLRRVRHRKDPKDQDLFGGRHFV